MNQHRRIELLDQLLELTRAAKVDWREEAPQTFAASLPRHFLTLASRDRDGLAPYSLMIQSADGSAIVDLINTFVDSEPGDPPPELAGEVNERLDSLFESVRRQVLDLDASVATLFEDLGKLKEGDGSS